MSFLDNVGNALGFGSTPDMPNAPGVDMSSLAYGGSGANAQMYLNQSFNKSNAAQGRAAPNVTGAQADYGNANTSLANSAATLQYGQQPALGNQQALMNKLRDQALGYGGPSAAQLAMKSQSEDAMRQQLAMANTSGNPAAMIAAQNNNVNQQNSLTQQLGVQRAQEQLNAQNLLGNVANQYAQQQQGTAAQQAAMAQQQANMAQFQTGNVQQALLANQNANLQQTGLNDAASQYYYGQAMNQLNNQAQMNLAGQQLQQQQYATQGQMAQAQQAANTSGLGNLAAMAGTAAMFMSDERMKVGVRPAGADISDAFRHLGGSGYGYASPGAPGAAPGLHFGPMAQELEQTRAGSSVVGQGPGGVKMVDAGRLALMNASETAKQRRELDKLKAAIRGGQR